MGIVVRHLQYLFGVPHRRFIFSIVWRTTQEIHLQYLFGVPHRRPSCPTASISYQRVVTSPNRSRRSTTRCANTSVLCHMTDSTCDGGSTPSLGNSQWARVSKRFESRWSNSTSNSPTRKTRANQLTHKSATGSARIT